MIQIVSLFVALLFTATTAANVRAQESLSSLVGVWKVKSVETKELASGKAIRPFGNAPSGTFIFTTGGQMVGMQYAENRKAPASSNPTDTERVALHSSMSAYSGRYRVEGKKLFIAIEESSIQSWNGTTRIINIELSGSKLTGTSESFKSLITGAEVVAIIAWERTE